ncbi:MAG: hypothetical protein ACI8VT_002325 [Saprospiraceae bacterium]
MLYENKDEKIKDTLLAAIESKAHLTGADLSRGYTYVIQSVH